MRLLAGVLVALVYASGCTSPRDIGAEPDADAPIASVDALALSSCREQIGIFPISQTQAAPYVPDGFGLLPPLPPDVFPDADPTGTTATLLFVAFYCDDPEVSFVVPWFPAEPPADLRVGNASYHAVALPPIIQGAALEAWLTAADIPFVPGDVSQSPGLDTPAAMTTTLIGQGPSIDIEVQGTSPRTPAATPAELLPLFIVQDRQVVARLDLHISEHTHWQFGPATAQVTGFLQPGPGLSTHSQPGMTMRLAVETDALD